LHAAFFKNEALEKGKGGRERRVETKKDRTNAKGGRGRTSATRSRKEESRGWVQDSLSK